ncbi:hypothetical protein [Candidatus Endoriftia persephone]|jgi:hypothetical protein|uniref:Uncharacterized protein n=3 Tax=Gammaproteobacteria TaxID=1236 RepID=G2FJE5_9GAMM|nr:hypothetical protein [Candidatus Endoriftia persephone]EGV50968.1 hypothetical protein Rifp1Sym_cb00190 [endosymbiont of Riftia pachyptila (vent Ph05)]EGW53092.1 hypothetical protein TevJSym_bn00180 [endosymbiont of Tevnia jerichonana (vent Tica)]USF88226.1 dihydroorotase [Candidatus Endoriftia persephone]
MRTPELQPIEAIKTKLANEERQRIRRGILSQLILARQNRHFHGTYGVSDNNRHAGFLPAFQDLSSGSWIISQFADGRPAPMHLLDGLPQEWICRRDQSGRALSTREGIVAGFVRDGIFYTREAAVQAAAH